MPDLDSRARRAREVRPLVRLFGSVVHGQPVFCLSCGKQDGFVTIALPPGVFDLCGECEARYGVPPEMLARPDIDRKVVHA